MRTAFLSLLFAACAVTGDADSSSAADTTAPGLWGLQIALRDNTSVDPDLATPAGGWYVTPIHTSLLPNGKIFVTGWSRSAKDSCTFPEGSRRNGVSFVLDPASLPVGGASTAWRELEITPLAENVEAATPWKGVLYCAGHAPVVIGDESAILLTGGSRYLSLGDRDREVEEGIRQAHFAFAGRSAPTIERVADGLKSGPLCGSNDGQELLAGETRARGGKWYPTNTRMPDGRVLVTGGFTGGPPSRCVGGGQRHSASAEVFDPAARAFTALVQPEDLPPGFGERFAPGDKDYTHTVLLPEPVAKNGHRYEYALMGYAGLIVLMTTEPGVPAADRFWVPPNGSRPGDTMAWDSTMALVSTGEIMVMGGTNDAGVATKIHLYMPRTDTWRSVDAGVGRRNAGSVLLPDGRVLIVNGSRDDSAALGRDERTRPLLFDPEAPAATALRELDGFPGDAERGYHSFALLAKDGSIVVGGGIYPASVAAGAPKPSDIGCERTAVQRWAPPYLGAGVARPVASSLGSAGVAVPMRIGGANVDVRLAGATLHATKGAALMALGSFTHGFDQNQRYVRLGATVHGDRVTLTPPASATQAPPGDYLLFLVSDAGVPSEGVHVRLAR